jgi:hypothetical protein
MHLGGTETMRKKRDLSFCAAQHITVVALASCITVGSANAGSDNTSTFPGIDQLPPGYQPVDGFIAGMGKPYALGDIKQLPSNPIYWTHDDKIIGFEVIVATDQIDSQTDLRGIQPISGLPPIDHLELMHYDVNPGCTCDAWVVRVQFVSDYYLERMY